MRHDECNKNIESARRSRANWTLFARRLGFGAAMILTLVTVVARMLVKGFERDIREMESERLEKVIKDSGTRENFLKQKRVTMFFSF